MHKGVVHDNYMFRLLLDGDSTAGIQRSDLVRQDAFTTDNTHKLRHTFFQTADGLIPSGVLEYAPCRKISMSIRRMT
mgnify:FL=1